MAIWCECLQHKRLGKDKRWPGTSTHLEGFSDGRSWTGAMWPLEANAATKVQ
jgi:hypothetical protein